jgi:plasmid stabilization system protein ParE
LSGFPEAAASRLADHPESGRTLPEFPDSRYREVIVPPYCFFCRFKEDIVWIVCQSESRMRENRKHGLIG